MKMDALLEVVASSIWNDSLVDDVELADAPAVEPSFGKQFFEHPIIANLNIPAPNPQPPDVARRRECAGIAVMKQPSDAGGFAVYPFDRQKLSLGKTIK